MNNSINNRFQSINILMNALTVAGLAVACALVVAFSGIPGLLG